MKHGSRDRENAVGAGLEIGDGGSFGPGCPVVVGRWVGRVRLWCSEAAVEMKAVCATCEFHLLNLTAVRSSSSREIGLETN